MEDIKVTIGKNIRIFRKQKGYTLQNLSKQIGITHQQLSRIENGSGTATATLERIAAILDVDIKNLMNEPETNLKNSISHIKNFIPNQIYNNLRLKMFDDIIKSANDNAISGYQNEICNKLVKAHKIRDIMYEIVGSKNKYQFTEAELEKFCNQLIVKFTQEIFALSKIDYDFSYDLDDE